MRVPRRVRRVLRRCLERSPTQRFATTRELLQELDGTRAPLRRRPRPAALLAAAGALLAIGAALAVRPWSAGPAGVAPTARRVEVAVLPLADDTGDPSLAWTAAGIAEMLTAQLADAPSVRVVDSARVQSMLRDLKLRDARRVRRGPAPAGRAARSGPARHRPACAARGPASGWTSGSSRSTARTRRPRGRCPWKRRTRAGCSGRCRTSAAGSATSWARPAPDGQTAPEPPTASLDAAQAYREGREYLSTGDALNAAPSFARAVQADPRYVEALLGLSEASAALGRQEEAVAAVERAVSVLGSADTRLAWRVRARQALLRGEPREAEKAYAELAARYPNDGEALLELAAAQAAQGDQTRTLATLRQVTEVDKGDPRGWFLLGKHLILAGDARQALSDPLVRSLALMTQLGNEQGQADVLNAMGVAHHRLGEFTQALTRYGEAAALRQRIGDARGSATSLRNRASIHLAQGRLAEAEPDLRAARALYSKIGDLKGQADVWNDFGALEEGRGRYADARRAYQAALRIRRELGDEHQLAQSYDNLGYAFFVEGEYDNALVYWQQALELRRRIGDKGGVVLSKQNLGFLQTAQGRWPEAMKSFLEALQESRDIELTNAQAVSHGNIALLHQYEGRHAAALASYAEALGILKGLDDRRGLAEYTIKQATALIELGRLDEAREQLQAAQPWVQATGNREQAADLQLALGDWHAARGEDEPARRAYAEAVELAGASHSRGVVLRARIARAGAAAPSEAAARSRELGSAVGEADALGDVLLRIRAREALARAQLAAGRPRAAEAAARQAIEEAQRCGWKAGLPALQSLLTRIRERASG